MHIARITSIPLAATALLACPLLAADPETGDGNPDGMPVSPGPVNPAEIVPHLDGGSGSAGGNPAATAAASVTPSSNVTINLINRLVEKNILSRAEADEMIRQAEADAEAVARSQEAALPPEPTSEEEMRINYIPEVVRTQMRDEIKQDLMAQTREQQWGGTPMPEWPSKFQPFGDIRLRSESVFFDETNSKGSFPDFNRINTGSPYDLSKISNPNVEPPQRNVDEDRQRMRLRARVGTEIMLGDGFNAGLRVATGNDSSPTSSNQSLSGNFSKYAIWLDQAHISYDAEPMDDLELKCFAGRFANPFFSTEIQWDDDLNFDGLAVKGKVRLEDSMQAFFTAGYFPVYNTDFNFASNQADKFASRDRWLSGLQAGIEWKISDDLSAKFAAACYDFSDMRGKLSTPFIPLSDKDAGDTDGYRPPFAQNGNTYMQLRNIDGSTAANDSGNKYQYQYFGLASDFRNATLTGRLDYDGYEPVRLSLVAEATKNIAFNAASNRPINNLDGNNAYDGGDTAWLLNFIVGKPAMEVFGDWQATLGYRYVESDAVVDGFTDSDFGGGGTNVMGFMLGGNFALSKEVRCGVRWLGSDEITGPALRTDTLQFDLNARF